MDRIEEHPCSMNGDQSLACPIHGYGRKKDGLFKYFKRRGKARAWLGQYEKGVKYGNIEAKAVDCTKVVGFRTLKPGKRLGQHVRVKGKPGKWFTEPGTDKNTLAIDLEGRVYRECVVKEPIRVMRSRAADLHREVAPGVMGKGGGPQITMPPGWESKVTWIGG